MTPSTPLPEQGGFNEKLSQILAAVYIAGVSSGLHRDITDPEEIVHRREAFIKSNPACKEALAALEEIMATAKPGRASAQIWHETPSDAWEMGIDQYEQNIRQAFSNGGGE